MVRARAFSIVVALLSAGCSATPYDPAGAVSPGGDPPPPPPVDKTPSADELTDSFGVFVTPNGTPDGDGTQARPFGAIAPAIAKAKATSKRVYICAGRFAEAVTVTSGIPLIGNLDCSAPVWKIGTARTRIEAPTSPALRAENIEHPTRIEGFDFVAPDGTVESPTSVGFLGKNAGKITIVDSSITAGSGHAGAAGVDGPKLTFTESARPERGAEERFSIDAALDVGGSGGTGTCTGAPGFSSSRGGTGGLGGTYYSTECTSGSCLVFNKPYTWVQYERAPRTGDQGGGTPASNGTNGSSASTLGGVTMEGFLPSNGAPGTHGTSGKGGAGGGGSVMDQHPTARYQQATGASGPGGGAGGCPGLAGTAGKGGGASIGALLSNSADLTFEVSEILASQGGTGGKGSFGSSATKGGSPGDPRRFATPAEEGEPGGRAGTSGHGAGGSSYGIAHTGGAPQLRTTLVRAGTPGAGVPAETTADDLQRARTIGASISGEAKDVFAF